MQLSATTPPANILPPVLTVTLTWDAGNHLFDDVYQLHVGAGATPAPAPLAFQDAVAATRELVRAGETQVPGFGKLAPVHALIAVEGGFVPATLATKSGFRLPIDGEIANGRGGAELRGLTVDRARTDVDIAALVGSTELVDLRTAPLEQSFWRTKSLKNGFGPWTPKS